MAGSISQVTDANFEAEVIQSEVPVLVDFWAVWCMPCKAITPLLEQLSTEKGEALKVVKLDVQTNQKTAMKYGVTNIPTLLVFKGGEIVNRKVGAGGGLAALRGLVEKYV